MSEKIKLRDVFNRNVILILLIQFFTDCANNWANSFINMGATAAGISVAAIGFAASAYSITGMLTRMPAGKLADSDKKRIALIVAISFRTICVFLIGVIGRMGNTNFIIMRALQGIGWSMVGVIIPAVVAMMLDKRTMGTTYAFIAVVDSLAKQYSKAGGAKVYELFGMIPALVCSAAFAVVAIILIFFLDFKDDRILHAMPKKEQKGFLKGFNLKYLPVCLMLNMVVFAWLVNGQYNNVVAAERGIDIASILVITGTIASVISFASSMLCDFIHPKFVLFILYICLAIGIFLTGHAYTYNTFLLSQIFCVVGTGYTRVISIFLFKNCDETEKGSVHATNYFATDIINIFSGALVGSIMGAVGYEMGYDIIAGFTLCVAILFILFGKKLMNIGNAQKAE